MGLINHYKTFINQRYNVTEIRIVHKLSLCDNGGIDRVDAGKKTFDHWKKNLRICTLNIVQLKSLNCTTFAGLGNLNMQFNGI